MEHADGTGRLGRTGLKVSRICPGHDELRRPGVAGLGARRGGQAEPFVRRAVEAGINFFDTADMYSLGASEEVTGPAAARAFGRRDDYVLATKVFCPMGDGPERRGACPASTSCAGDRRLAAPARRRLRRPLPDPPLRPDTPIEETMEALHDVVRAGKARYIGASSMYAWQFAKAQHIGRAHGWTPVRVDAEPLQPGLPRGGAGDDAALPRTRASA